jgi:hypothetical protein
MRRNLRRRQLIETRRHSASQLRDSDGLVLRRLLHPHLALVSAIANSILNQAQVETHLPCA